jgi:hypothetical protein
MELLLTQKNDIFDIILEEGFYPSDFTFKEEILGANEIVTYLKFRGTNYYFSFRLLKFSGYETEFSPAEKSLIGTDSVRGGWRLFLIRVRRWLRHIKRESNLIDKWEAYKLGLQVAPFTFSLNDESEYFSVDELKLISLKIDLIKQGLKELELPEETIKQLNIKLDALNEKADKLSKTDWKEIFIGAIIATIFNLSIPSESALAIWEIIKQTFNQYIIP